MGDKLRGQQPERRACALRHPAKRLRRVRLRGKRRLNVRVKEGSEEEIRDGVVLEPAAPKTAVRLVDDGVDEPAPLPLGARDERLDGGSGEICRLLAGFGLRGDLLALVGQVEASGGGVFT